MDRARHDFGVARQDVELATEFTLRNDGNAPLHVSGVHGNCGCVVGRVRDATIAPGASTGVAVTFRTHALAGAQTKWVQVVTDDAARPRTTLEVVVDVAAGVVVEPANLYFPLARAGSSPAPSLVVKWKEGVGRPFAVTAVEGRDVDADFETKPWAAPPWRGFEITARFRRPPPIGTVAGRATIRTDAPDRPEIEALVGGAVAGKVWLTQTEASVGVVPEGRGAVTNVLVRGFDATVDLGTVTATAESGRVEARAVPAPGEKGAYNVEIRLPADAVAGPVDDTVRVTTGVAGEETRRIRVRGEVVRRTR